MPFRPAVSALALMLGLCLIPAAAWAQDASDSATEPASETAEAEAESVFALPEGFSLSGYVAAEGRAFFNSPLYDGEEQGTGLVGIAAPKLSWESEDRFWQASLQPYLRWDSVDSKATYADLREAYVLASLERWEILAGVNTVFWGVTEANHLVDIVNSTAPVENLDAEDKLGQPMIRVTRFLDFDEGGSAALSAFLLPFFRQPVLTGSDGRLSGPLVVDTQSPRYDRPGDEAVLDWALRYTHTYEDFDIGLSLFRGYDRDPLLDPNLLIQPTGQVTVTGLSPRYETITQLGFDGQWTAGSALWKLEAISRWGQGAPFVAVTGGIEYTLYSVVAESGDVGLLAEASWDGRDNEDAPSVVFDNDIFLGTRITLNDPQDTTFLAGGSIDWEDGSTFVSAEAERRLSDAWKAELELRWIVNSDNENLLNAIRADDYITLRFSRFF